jgi:hypothetical protein
MRGHRLACDTMIAFSMLKASLGSPAMSHSRVRSGLPSVAARLKCGLTGTP